MSSTGAASIGGLPTGIRQTGVPLDSSRRQNARWYRYWERLPDPVGGPVEAETTPVSDVVESPADESDAPDDPSAGRRDDAEPTFHVEPGRAFVLTVANQKGGVGKTTTAISVAAALADDGARVLLVDLDPQGNATSGVGLGTHGAPRTVYDVLLDDVPAEEAVLASGVPGLDVLPSNIDLAGAEIELVSVFSREQRLRRALDPLRSRYDVVLVDCPPSLGLLTVNALTAADGVLVPIQCEYYALEGLGALGRNVELIRGNLNPRLEIAGFVMTMLDGRTRLSQQVVDDVRAHFGERVFTTRIPRTVRLAEAPGFGQPITVFDPSSRGALAYRRLAREVAERLGLPTAGGAPAVEATRGARA